MGVGSLGLELVKGLISIGDGIGAGAIERRVDRGPTPIAVDAQDVGYIVLDLAIFLVVTRRQRQFTALEHIQLDLPEDGIDVGIEIIPEQLVGRVGAVCRHIGGFLETPAQVGAVAHDHLTLDVGVVDTAHPAHASVAVGGQARLETAAFLVAFLVLVAVAAVSTVGRQE